MRVPSLDMDSSTRHVSDFFRPELGETLLRNYGKIDSVCPYPVRSRKNGFQFMRPCGQCVHCKVVRRKELTGRCVAEADTQPSICVTLTLSDQSIDKKDWRSAETWAKEMRTMRHRIERRTGKKPLLRWTGETGGQTDRPHAHALIFGVPDSWVPEKQLKYQNLDWWKHGHCTVDKVTSASAGYVLGYITDKEKAGEKLASRASPNIGRAYLERWIADMQDGRKKHGCKYTSYPDQQTGFLESAAFEIDHFFYPLDQHWRAIVQADGLLAPVSEVIADFRTEMEIHKEIKEHGTPEAAANAREQHHQAQLKRKRECSAFRDQPVFEENGYKHKVKLK